MGVETEAHTTRTSGNSKTTNSEEQREERKVKHILVGLFDTEQNAARVAKLKAGIGAILGTLTAPRTGVEDTPGKLRKATKSMCGDQKHIKELGDLGFSSYRQFECTGNMRDINKAIESWEMAFALSSGLQTGMLDILLNNLGCAYGSRFKRLGELSDLSRAIDSQAQAVSLTPDGHPDKPGRLSNLGISYQTRFRRLGELSDLNKAIDSKAQAVSLTPDGHPDKPECLNNLGILYQTRFDRLGELSDLNKAIESKAQAVSLTPDGHPDKLGFLNNLGVSYHTRLERLGNLSDLNTAIESIAWAVSLTPDGHPDKPMYLNNLGNSYQTRFRRLGELSDLNKAVDFQAQAVSLAPDGHTGKPACLNNLGNAYRLRFERLGELSDLNTAIDSQAQAVSLTPNSHIKKPGRLDNLGISYHNRFDRLGEISDLNTAIDFQAQAVSLTPDGHTGKPACLNNLGNSYRVRFERMGELSDLSRAIDFQAQAVSLTPDGHPDKPGRLDSLGSSYQTRFRRLGELSDLNTAVDSQAQAVSFTPDGHPDKSTYLNNLGNAYRLRFERLGELSDLNTAIDSQAQAVSLTPEGHPIKPAYLDNLGLTYHARARRLLDPSDVRSAISCFKGAAQSPTGPPSARFRACRNWAGLSSFETSSLPHIAYTYGMELLPQLVWVGTTLGRRYELIAEIGDFTAEAASHAISLAAFDVALEWLEAGRSMVWGQIASLRTPFDQLSIHDPELASQLQEVGCKLEQAGSRSYSLQEIRDNNRDLVSEANSHIGLALRWGELLAKARSIPKFDDLCRSPKLPQLLGSATDGPIAIINIHKSRCDALILQPNTEAISHVPLTAFSQGFASSARAHLVSLVGHRGFKKAGGKSGSNVNRRSSLEEPLNNLWLGIVRPVLEHLGLLDEVSSDTLPHITWCTTGLLSFLPLHAAGRYDQPRSCTFDHVISSYTPTLSALLSNRSRPVCTPSGVVAVGQVHTAGFASLPYVNNELEVINRHASMGKYLQLKDSEATIVQVLDAMEWCSWIHLACHGIQDTADPAQSAFHLHDGPLTLAVIAKRSFTNKGLAFLSACQTAAGDERMPDEAVHLAAGMLAAGYPSVIGTMWSIEDEDGPAVADRVYAVLLEHGKMDHTRAAWALHQAVGELRTRVGAKDIARWAPFIHIGS